MRREEDLVNHSWLFSELDRRFEPRIHRNLSFEKF
jgi:hypothetical protein